VKAIHEAKKKIHSADQSLRVHLVLLLSMHFPGWCGMNCNKGCEGACNCRATWFLREISHQMAMLVRRRTVF
jgi:hypothetical protein